MRVLVARDGMKFVVQVEGAKASISVDRVKVTDGSASYEAAVQFAFYDAVSVEVIDSTAVITVRTRQADYDLW